MKNESGSATDLPFAFGLLCPCNHTCARFVGFLRCSVDVFAFSLATSSRQFQPTPAFISFLKGLLPFRDEFRGAPHPVCFAKVGGDSGSRCENMFCAGLNCRVVTGQRSTKANDFQRTGPGPVSEIIVLRIIHVLHTSRFIDHTSSFRPTPTRSLTGVWN